MSTQYHHLAAILFTDIVGYTAMMQEDEELAIEKLECFKMALSGVITEHSGEIIQYYGDGCLATFTSCVDAVKAAIDLQNQLNAGACIPVRVGIHEGEIRTTQGNIYGDAVNIASRIQALAPTGSIYVSEAVQLNIANKKEITSRFVKLESLKNVASPVSIYEIIREGAADSAMNAYGTDQLSILSEKVVSPNGHSGLQESSRLIRRIPILKTLLLAALFLGTLFLGFAIYSWYFPAVSNNSSFSYPIDLRNPEMVRSPWVVTAKVSPDGTKILYLAGSGYHVYDLKSGVTTMINASLVGLNYNFSPNSDSLVVRGTAFVGSLNVVSIATREYKQIKDSILGIVPHWSRDGWIYFTDIFRNVRKIRSDGSSEQLVLKADPTGQKLICGEVFVLPNGRGLLYPAKALDVLDQHSAEIQALDFKTGISKALIKGVKVVYVQPDILLISNPEGRLSAAKFDAEKLKITSRLIPVLDNIETHGPGYNSEASISITESGDILFIGRDSITSDNLQWIERNGRIAREQDVPDGWVYTLAISPDKTLLATSLHRTGKGATHIWLKDTKSGAEKKLTNGPILDYFPVFLNRSSELAFVSPRGGKNWDLYKIPVDAGSVPEKILDRPGDIFKPDFSPDDSWVVFHERTTQFNTDIWAYHFPDSITKPVAVTKHSEKQARLSADGRWIAYLSDETGQDEIYVQPFPESGNKRWQITTKGVTDMQWSSNGREIFFADLNKNMYAVSLETAANFKWGAPTFLFSLKDLLWSGIVSEDNTQFLAIKRDMKAPGKLVLVTNWIAEVREKLDGVK